MTVTTITLPVPFAVRAVNCYLLEGDPLTVVTQGRDPAPQGHRATAFV